MEAWASDCYHVLLYFKVVEMTLVSTASMRVLGLNREFGSAT